MIDDRRQRILIADDDPSIRRLLAASLGREGYRTAGACDGGEALDAMREKPVSLDKLYGLVKSCFGKAKCRTHLPSVG